MKLFVLILLFPSLLFAKTAKIAVIDSGLDDLTNVKLCKDGLQDFTNTNMNSSYRKHGNNITHIITDGLEKKDYCIYHLKYYKDYDLGPLDNEVKAIDFAIKMKVDIINLSLSGPYGYATEFNVINKALAAGIIVVVAAGNDGFNLDEKCLAFPACYPFHNDRFIVVSNSRGKTANHGKVAKFSVDGENIRAGNVTMSGSSQSTALVTHSIVKRLLKENK